MSPELLFFMAMVLFVAAIVVYLKKEDSSYTRVANGVEEQGQSLKEVEDRVRELKKSLDDLQEEKVLAIDFKDKIKNKLELIEMRLNSLPKQQSVVHKDAPIPQPLRMSVDILSVPPEVSSALKPKVRAKVSKKKAK